MSTQRIAQLFGAIFVLVGILGLALGGTGMPTTLLLGLFPVNLLHNVVHLLLGVWGLMAARSAAGAATYCKITGPLYIVLTVAGFLAADPMSQFLGLVPLGGNDRWLHLALGAVLSYGGFMGAKQTA